MRLLDKRGKIAAPDRKLTGDEPCWNDADTISIDDYYMRRTKALNFYSQYGDTKTFKPFVLQWMKNNGYTKSDLAKIKSCPVYNLSFTACKLARMLNEGMPDIHPDAEEFYESEGRIIKVERVSALVKRDVNVAIDSVAFSDSKGKVDKKPKPNIQARIKNKVYEVIICQLDILLDDIIEMKEGTTPARIPTLNLSALCKSENVPAQACKYIIEVLENTRNEFNSALDRDDPQLVQGYNWLSVPQLRRIVSNYDKMISETKAHGKMKSGSRKPRVKKPKDAEKQISKLKYSVNSKEYSIDSVNPLKLPFSQVCYTFNTKSRKLSIYRASGSGGFTIKGTTLKDFDPDSSITFTLRKPGDILPLVLSSPPKKLEKLIDSIKTKKSTANGRMNEHTIILKIIENK